MTIKEIKGLTKFLTDEEVEKIKKEIKSKETVLKNEDMEEEEITQVLNTLFAILVIERTLESEIEGIEEIRAELEQELLESYEIYDSHMARYKKEEKKKKKNWLLDFLFLSDRINSQKKGIGATNKTIANLQKELSTLKQQKSNENLKQVVRDRRGTRFDEFLNMPRECRNPHHHHDSIIDQIRCERRKDKLVKDIIRGNKRETLPRGGNKPRIEIASRTDISRVSNNHREVSKIVVVRKIGADDGFKTKERGSQELNINISSQTKMR